MSTFGAAQAFGATSLAAAFGTTPAAASPAPAFGAAGSPAFATAPAAAAFGAAGSTFGSPSSLGAAPAFGATSLLGGATAFGSPLPTQFSLEERARLIEWASLNGRRGSRRCACLRRPVAAWGRRRVWRKRPNSLCVNTKWWLRQLHQPSTGIQCTCADSRFRCCSFRQSALLTSARLRTQGLARRGPDYGG